MDISCLNERLSSAASILLSLWFSLSGLAAVIGNAVVLWSFYKNESLRTMSNRFLASLSVADFLVGLVIDPTLMALRCLIQPVKIQILTNVKVVDMLWIHSTAATVFNLCCVSVDRFIAIRFPFRYQDIITKKRCYTVIIAVWLISTLLPFSLFLGDSPADIDKVWLSLTFLTFATPLTVVSFCYFWIFKVARKQAKMIKRDRNNCDDDNTSRTLSLQNYKAIKTIGFVLGVCIVSWMPCLVLSVVHHYDVTEHDQCSDHYLWFVVWPWIEAIALTSSAINPWIYCFRNGEFREALRRNFQWCSFVDSKVTSEVALELDGNQRLRNTGIAAS